MPTVLILVLITFSNFIYAGDINEQKFKMLTHIAAKETMMQAHKACISAASNQDALQACRQTHRQKKQRMMQQHHEIAADIATQKAQVLTRIANKQAILNAHKVCVSKATNSEALSVCHQHKKEQMMGMNDSDRHHPNRPHGAHKQHNHQRHRGYSHHLDNQ